MSTLIGSEVARLTVGALQPAEQRARRQNQSAIGGALLPSSLW